MQHPVLIQILLIAAVALGAALLLGAGAGVAAAWGGGIVLVNTLILYRHYRRAVLTAGEDIGLNTRIAYRCSFERLAMAVILLSLGLGILKLQPLPLIGAFVALQVAVLMGRFEESLLRKADGKH